jgi:hypothetical protein
MSHSARSGPGNGIWMCETHAKLIDTDEERFSADLLHRWKRQLRHLTQRALDRGRDIVPQTELIRLKRRIGLEVVAGQEGIAESVAQFFDDTGVRFVWGGEVADSARQALTEILFNEAQHGVATWARIETHGFAIRLVTDGRPFSLTELRDSATARGGKLTVSVFERAYADTHVLSYDRPRSNRQRYLITDIRHSPLAHNPCSTTTSQLRAASPSQIQEKFADCSDVHLYLSSHWTISAGDRDLGRLSDLPAGTSVVLHVPPGPMIEALIERHSHVSIRLAK